MYIETCDCVTVMEKKQNKTKKPQKHWFLFSEEFVNKTFNQRVN